MGKLNPEILGAGAVHLWSSDGARARLAEADLRLSTAERARLEGMPLPRRRREFGLGRHVLRTVASLYLGIPAEDVRVGLDARGKPFLDHGPDAPAISLSHSGPRCVCVIASGTHVGVDLEQVRQLDLNRLAARVLSSTEEARFQGLKAQVERERFFFEMWIRKEAVAKLVGLGLGLPFPEIEFVGEGVSRIPDRVDASLRSQEMATRLFEWDEFQIAVAFLGRAVDPPVWKGSVLA